MANVVLGTGFLANHLLCSIPSIQIVDEKTIRDSSPDNKMYENVFVTILFEETQLNRDVDIELICAVQRYLLGLNVQYCIYFSTLTIYNPLVCDQTEDDELITHEFVGKHRYMMEQWIKSNFQRYTILRLPCVFGLGVENTMLSDLQQKQIQAINPYSFHQFYYLEDLVFDMDIVRKKAIKLVNLASEPVRAFEVVSSCFENLVTSVLDIQPENTTKSKFKTLHKPKTQYWCEKVFVLMKMKDFLCIQKSITNRSTQLIVCSTLWNKSWRRRAIAILKRYNIRDIALHWSNRFVKNTMFYTNQGMNVPYVYYHPMKVTDSLLDVVTKCNDKHVIFDVADIEYAVIPYTEGVHVVNSTQHKHCNGVVDMCRNYIHELRPKTYVLILRHVDENEFEKLIKFFALNYAVAIS